MAILNYYRLLGLPRDASAADIRKAYRALVLKHHPDRNPGNLDAENIFKAVGEAYRTLSNEKLRVKYDLITAHEEVPRVTYPKPSPSATTKPAPPPRPAPAQSAPKRHEAPDAPLKKNRSEGRLREQGLRTYLAYQAEMNELDPWDGVLGIVFGISAALFAHAFWRGDDRQPQFIVLFLWMMVPLFLGPTGYFIGKKLESLIEDWFDLKNSSRWWLVSFTKTLPLIFPLVICCSALVSSQFFRAGVFTWRILPAAIAAGLCAIGASGVGRAFVLPCETSSGKMLGALVGAAIGFIGGAVVGLMLGLLSAGRGMDVLFFEGFFSAGFGGAVGAAIASFVGSLRSFRPGDEDEAF